MKIKERKFQFRGNVATVIFYIPLFFLFLVVGGIVEKQSRLFKSNRENPTNLFE